MLTGSLWVDAAGTITTEVNPLGLKKREIIVVNTLRHCKVESDKKKLIKPLEYPESRASMITKMYQSSLCLIKDRLDTAKKTGVSCDLETQITYLKTINTFYERKVSPTYSELFQDLQEFVPTLKEFLPFKYELMVLGFDYRRTFDEYVLIEDPLITFERCAYTKLIKQMRYKGYNIYYINERVIDKDQNFYNLSKKKAQASISGSEYTIFFHAISKRGFTNGLFCKSATEDDFFKWVHDHLLNSIQPSSVIVLDNSPLHGIKQPKQVNIYDTKNEMQQWLQNHNVPWSEEMNKAQLYELVQENPVFEETSRVEELIKEHGHTVLRMPTYLDELTPLEIIWKIIKQTPIPSDIIQEEILSKFEYIHEDEYRAYDKQIEALENDINELDTNMEKALNDFLLHLERSKAKNETKEHFNFCMVEN